MIYQITPLNKKGAGHWLAQTWLRIASSVQSRQDAHWKTIGQVSQTARWKRCVARRLLIYARDS